MLRCSCYAQTNSLSVRANVWFRVRLVDAGTAVKTPGKYGNFSFCYLFYEFTEFSRIKFSFRDTVQPKI